jgi:5-methylcytosine-specific restriction endonuclease McrA
MGPPADETGQDHLDPERQQLRRRVHAALQHHDQAKHELAPLLLYLQDEARLLRACEACGEIHPAVLDTHHKDGNPKNNDPSNLQTLCANCHRSNTTRTGTSSAQTGRSALSETRSQPETPAPDHRHPHP